MADSTHEYWFCLRHKTVEGKDGCASSDRLGPYATAEEASTALERVEQRNEAWDNDPAWNDEDDWPDEGDGAGSSDPTP